MTLKRSALVAVLLLCACSSTPGGGAADYNEKTSQEAEAWLATDSESAVLLRWTEGEGGQVSGVLQLAQLDGFAVDGQSLPIEGVIGDGTITLGVDGLFGVSTTLTGEHSKDRLTLYWPDEDGTLDPMQFDRATISEYNAAVANLETIGSDQRAAAAEAQAESQAIADADDRLAAARRNLEEAIQGFESDKTWASYSIDNLRYALDSLHDAVSQLEDTVASDPEYAESDLAWVESSYEYLEDEADYALGADSLGLIGDALDELEFAALEVQSAIEGVRQAEDLYLSSEFAPYDSSAESALVEQAQSILDQSGPAAIADYQGQVQSILDEGEVLIEYARSLVR